LFVATVSDPTLIGIAALVTATGGIASTIMALRKSRSEETTECLENLKKCREESERLAKELHDLKMGNEDEDK
jgi:hypothetical protein